MIRFLLAAAALAIAPAALAPAALAQVVNPADKARSRAEEVKPPPEEEAGREGREEPPDPAGRTRRVPSYAQPPVEEPAGAPAPGRLREEERISAYRQPRWTAHRRFPTTRIYVRPEGFFEMEWWIRPEVPRRRGPVETLTQLEAEIGLGHRLQLDLYLDFKKVGHKDDFTLAGQRVELRYALADWDEIPLNPTLYAEYAAKAGGPDVIELKLLLGGEIAPRWHWGTNLVFERELSGDLANEFQVTGGLSYTVVDTLFSVGAEVKASLANTRDDRDDLTENVRLGPSIQWRPHPASHIDVALLFGAGGNSNALEPFIVIGWEF